MSEQGSASEDGGHSPQVQRAFRQHSKIQFSPGTESGVGLCDF